MKWYTLTEEKIYFLYTCIEYRCIFYSLHCTIMSQTLTTGFAICFCVFRLLHCVDLELLPCICICICICIFQLLHCVALELLPCHQWLRELALEFLPNNFLKKFCFLWVLKTAIFLRMILAETICVFLWIPKYSVFLKEEKLICGHHTFVIKMFRQWSVILRGGQLCSPFEFFPVVCASLGHL